MTSLHNEAIGAIVGQVSPTIPVGKALWLRSLSNLLPVSQLMKEADIKWISTFGDAAGNGVSYQIDRENIAILRGNGIEKIACTVYNTPRNRDIAFRGYDRFIAEGGDPIIILDMEGDWRNKADLAAALIEDAKSNFGPSIGVTSLPVPSMHRTIPWEVLIPQTAFSIPQVYDRDIDFNPLSHLVLRGIREYTALAQGKPVMPGFGLYKCRMEGERRVCDLLKTPLQLKAHVEILPRSRGFIGFALPGFFSRYSTHLPLWEALGDWVAPLDTPFPEDPECPENTPP